MKWADGFAIFLWLLSGGIFLISGHRFNSAGETGSIIAVWPDGRTALLDTLLAGQQIGLLVSAADSHDKGDTDLAVPVSETPCVNINTASETQLVSIKGVGPVLAASIVGYRDKKGIFRKKEDLLNVKGIGPAKMAKIAEQICF